MTVVAIQLGEFEYHDAGTVSPIIYIVADSRITRGTTITTDIAPKIMPITLMSVDRLGTPRHFPLYGFCFCGSMVGAFTTHSMAQYLLTNLFNNDPMSPSPSVHDVAKIYSEVAKLQMIEIGGRLLPEDAGSALFEGVVVGYSDAEACAFHFKPVVSGAFDMVIEKIELQDGMFRMGSGSGSFDSSFTALAANGTPPDCFKVVEHMLQHKANRTVGGFMQLAKVDHQGFNQLSTLEIPSGSKFADVTFLGHDLAEIHRPGGYKFGQQAHGVGDEVAKRMANGELIHTRS